MTAYEILKQNTDIWDLYTRKEEYARKPPDECRSVYRHKDKNAVMRPLASKFLIDNGIRADYPENKKFAVVLTHDVDHIYPRIPHTLLSSLYCLKNRDLAELSRQLFWRYKGKRSSPYRNFKKIMELESEYGAKSSFYFITADRDVKRVRYDIGELESDLGSIVDRGHEVGLHGGFYACTDIDEIKKEKNRLEKTLGKKVIGYRNHYLRFKVPDTWELLAEAGFKYDTTLGYNNIIGFRNGMCHPFKPFNLNTGKQIDILEIPLAIMDGAVFDRVRTLDRAWEVSRRLIDVVEKYNGVLTILWHNNIFSSPFRHGWEKLYIKILKYSYNKSAWLTCGKDVHDWWLKNGD